MTLPALRQRVQTYAREGEPLSISRTFWRFGSKRRFVATIEWLRWFPADGFFPQMTQTRDMRLEMVADAPYRAAAARRFANTSAISKPVRTASAPLSYRASA